MPAECPHPVKQHQMVSQTSFWSQPPNHLCAGRGSGGNGALAPTPYPGLVKCKVVSISLPLYVFLSVLVAICNCADAPFQRPPGRPSLIFSMESEMFFGWKHAGFRGFDTTLLLLHAHLLAAAHRAMTYNNKYHQIIFSSRLSYFRFIKKSGKSPLTTLISSLSH